MVNKEKQRKLPTYTSPRMLDLFPVNEKNGKGTGIGTLIPTCPASISYWYLRAAPPDVVNIAVPFPNGLLLEIDIASSSVGTVSIVKTGANISSVYAGFVIFLPGSAYC